MKKLLYLFLAITIFSCGGEDDGNGLSWECIQFTADMSSQEVQNLIANSYWNQESLAGYEEDWGAPICESWEPEEYDGIDTSAYYYLYTSPETGNQYYYELQSTCIGINGVEICFDQDFNEIPCDCSNWPN